MKNFELEKNKAAKESAERAFNHPPMREIWAEAFKVGANWGKNYGKEKPTNTQWDVDQWGTKQ